MENIQSQAAGYVDQAVGAAKEKYGEMTENTQLQVEGKLQATRGQTSVACAKDITASNGGTVEQLKQAGSEAVEAAQFKAKEVYASATGTAPPVPEAIQTKNESVFAELKDTVGKQETKANAQNVFEELTTHAQQKEETKTNAEAVFDEIRAQREPGTAVEQIKDQAQNITAKAQEHLDNATEIVKDFAEEHQINEKTASLSDQVVGKIKENIGYYTGDKQMEEAGRMQALHGAADYPTQSATPSTTQQ